MLTRFKGDATARLFPSSIREGIGYAVSVDRWNNRDAAWAVLNIRTWDGELDTGIYDGLNSHREDIEASIDPGPESQWEWLKFRNTTWCQVGLSRPGSIDDPPEQLEAIRAWMLDMLPRLKEVFEPRIRELLE